MWLKLNEKPIRSNEKYKLDSVHEPGKGLRYRLKINNINQEDLTNYTFIASNKYGESRFLIELLPKGNKKIISKFFKIFNF